MGKVIVSVCVSVHTSGGVPTFPGGGSTYPPGGLPTSQVWMGGTYLPRGPTFAGGGGVLPGKRVPPTWEGVPPQQGVPPVQVRSQDGGVSYVLATRRPVSLLRSRRRTFLLPKKKGLAGTFRKLKQKRDKFHVFLSLKKKSLNI